MIPDEFDLMRLSGKSLSKRWSLEIISGAPGYRQVDSGYDTDRQPGRLKP